MVKHTIEGTQFVLLEGKKVTAVYGHLFPLCFVLGYISSSNVARFCTVFQVVFFKELLYSYLGPLDTDNTIPFFCKQQHQFGFSAHGDKNVQIRLAVCENRHKLKQLSI